MKVIEIQDLTKDYGKGRGVFDLTFTVEEGEVFGFLGPNGAGKTTTIRHLMGFLAPDKGKVFINGVNCRKDSATIQKNLGYIPGEMPFLDDMTGYGFLKFMAKYRGQNNMIRAKDLISRFELDPKGKLNKMSKGMKQKIGIVAAFMHDPAVLILDEPTSGLDPLMQNRFIDLILQEKKRGKTILMSSHMFEEVERTCFRVGIIKSGRLVAVDSVDGLKASEVKKYIVTFEDRKSAAAFALTGLKVAGLQDNHVTVLIKNNMQDFIQAMGRFPVTNISAPSQNLEEIFLHYYGGENR